MTDYDLTYDRLVCLLLDIRNAFEDLTQVPLILVPEALSGIVDEVEKARALLDHLQQEAT